MRLNAEEQEIMDHINVVYEDFQRLGLSVNSDEFCGAIHTLQHFVMMHAAHRENPEFWNNWYG